ncbi:MAG: hypothetical protein PHU98_05115 [Mariniphaga sp.]|nr:hypothetical protein [Mariniphaga sp.]
MKTLNNKLHNTGLKSLTIGITLFATILTVQGMEENHATGANRHFASYLAEENESDINLEYWMLEMNNFFHHYQLTQDAETTLRLEGWMTEAGFFPVLPDFSNVTEAQLQLEEWMVSDSMFSQPAEGDEETQVLAQAVPEKVKRVYGVTFNHVTSGRRAFIIVEVEDPKLELERWMVDYRYWNKK